MLPSLLLAALFGPILVLVGLSMVIDPKRIIKIKDSVSKDPLLMMTGVSKLLIGILLVHIHNIWVLGWPVIITILAWMAVLKGISAILFPSLCQKAGKIVGENTTFFIVAGIILLVVGGFLTYMGYSIYFMTPPVPLG